jgi:hypothetical protein
VQRHCQPSLIIVCEHIQNSLANKMALGMMTLRIMAYLQDCT